MDCIGTVDKYKREDQVSTHFFNFSFMEKCALNPLFTQDICICIKYTR